MFGLQASIIRLGDVLNEASKYEDQTAPQDAATMGMAQAGEDQLSNEGA
jgi:hypothetical protein